ncbi:response regulator [Pedobacter insulae]|uniref:DNA-binding response regulator, NarL/FixJ family, contains REC and HTH domains n=1 Tax=Pedobacter insulae TaxID=414048 RepID=A0A1I2Z7M9_9SPHI|nr:response regulator transcription factor [Pedobacter insulae]SFH33862.1 DNA-binding response regulator, NarL/FixJ family, contains REC and HTH domains [Pedobacter insulae]
MAYNLFIYDDNDRLRHTLEALLTEASGFVVKTSFGNCDHAIEQIRENYPDLIIMDINMPGMGGINGVTLIKELFPEIKIVMHTVFEDDEKIFNSLCAGADGYLLKSTNPLKFVQSLHELMEGGASMSPFIAQRVLHFFRESKKVNHQFSLTKRELEVLTWLVKGHSYKMIAGECSVTIDTVKKHLQNIYHKLHVSCATEAVAKAIMHKIILLD